MVGFFSDVQNNFCFKGPLNPKQPTNYSRVNFHCLGVLLIWIIVGQGSTALVVGAGGSCLDIFTLIYPFFPLSGRRPDIYRNTVSKGR